MPHNMTNVGPLMAEIGLPVCGTLYIAHFNGFRVMVSLLHRRRSPEANQTLHNVWPSHGLVHYTFSGALAPDGILPDATFTLRPSLAFSYIGSVTTRHWRPSAKLCGVVQGMELRNFRRRRHLYSAGRPLRWASAHILVDSVIAVFLENSENDSKLKHWINFGIYWENLLSHSRPWPWPCHLWPC